MGYGMSRPGILARNGAHTRMAGGLTRLVTILCQRRMGSGYICAQFGFAGLDAIGGWRLLHGNTDNRATAHYRLRSNGEIKAFSPRTS